MKKTIIALLLAPVLVLTGCAFSPSPLTSPSPNSSQSPNTNKPQPSVKPVSFSGDLMQNVKPKQVSDGQVRADPTAFALNLLKAAYDGKNTVISPASAYLALSMVANGAKGGTLKEFETVLGASPADLNATCKALTDALNTSSDGLTLKTVNGIWYNTKQDFIPNQDFLQTNADWFGAAERAYDFAKPEALKDINQFVSDNTKKLIPSILDSLDDAAVMVLVNTLYFKGNWESPFNAHSTRDESFTTAGAGDVTVPTMAQTYDSVQYFEKGNMRGVILPYEDSRFAYVAVLPDDSLKDLMTALKPDVFKSLLSSATYRKVELFIPKYNVSGDYKFTDVLKKLGLQSAFDPAAADFSALGKADNNIFISSVVQKVVFKLNEKGTEAAAATAVQMAGAAAPMQKPEEPVILRLDHPFVYALMDMKTGTPLFMGTMDNPKTAK